MRLLAFWTHNSSIHKAKKAKPHQRSKQTFTMKFSTAFLTIASAIWMTTPALANTNLRTGKPQQQRVLIADSVNDVISFFVPILNFAIRTSFGALELTNIQESLEIPEVDFGVCTASASLNYALGAVTGLDTFEIESWELVEGTDLWETSGFLGLGEASWNATWLFKASFDDITSDTSASIAADACGLSIDESIGGAIVMEKPTLDLEVTIAGTSPNLLLLGLSVAQSIDFNDSNFSYDSLKLNFGGFGQDVDFDIGAFLEDIFVTNLNDNVVPAMMDALQNDLGNGLNFS